MSKLRLELVCTPCGNWRWLVSPLTLSFILACGCDGWTMQGNKISSVYFLGSHTEGILTLYPHKHSLWLGILKA